MNNETTAPFPLWVGSTEIFQVSAFLEGQPWNLSGGSATLALTDPNGHVYQLTASILGCGASVSTEIIPPPGTWERQWKLRDGAGIVQVCRPVCFEVGDVGGNTNNFIQLTQGGDYWTTETGAFVTAI